MGCGCAGIAPGNEGAGRACMARTDRGRRSAATKGDSLPGRHHLRADAAIPSPQPPHRRNQERWHQVSGWLHFHVPLRVAACLLCPSCEPLAHQPSPRMPSVMFCFRMQCSEPELLQECQFHDRMSVGMPIFDTMQTHEKCMM
jgi:hypothetical protein